MLVAENSSRRHRVRRKRFFKRNFKKLKKININEWQPSTIKKCKIEGYLCLFQSGQGRFSNNYCSSKESFTPEHQPGGVFAVFREKSF